MKWFKHETADRNRVEAKLIKSKFGIGGYGIYLSLLEVIGEAIDDHNIKDWGHVDPMHDISTLAAECCISDDELKEFLKFCDDRGIFEKKGGRLFSGLILRRLDEYANKIKSKSRQTPDKLPTKSRVSPARVEKSRVEKSRVEKKRNATVVASPSEESKKTEEVPMTIEQFVAWCKKSQLRHVQIIGEWAETVKPELRTKGQWESYIKRHLRAAKLLVPFSQEELERGYEKMMKEKDWLNRYTLETLLKFLT